MNSNSEIETEQIALDFAKTLQKGDVVLLSGTLGAGKTQFVRGCVKFFKINKNVSSPTFVIENQYQGEDILIRHIDLYRMSILGGGSGILSEIDMLNLFDSDVIDNSLTFVEWGEEFESLQSIFTKKIVISIFDDSRQISFID